jgi:hypothetical protein
MLRISIFVFFISFNKSYLIHDIASYLIERDKISSGEVPHPWINSLTCPAMHPTKDAHMLDWAVGF